MFNIKLIREHPEIVKQNLKKKQASMDDFLKVIDLDKRYLKLKQNVESLRNQRNVASSEINELQKQGKNIKEKIKEVKEIPSRIEDIENKIEKIRKELDYYLHRIPNIMHPEVPIGKDSSENKIIKKFGIIQKFNFPVLNHVELGEKLGLFDFEASAETSGNGFYYLKGRLALLNRALINFVIDIMESKGYTYIEPPLMVNKRIEVAKGDFDAFEKALYKIENEDLYMIPTSEDAILGMMMDKHIQPEKLPLRIFSYSMCFRKEIGSHGINEKGLWRTHQFNKVEQFIFCKPEDSWKFYEELRKNSEELFQKLKLPYRIVECCTGDLALWKAKSEDIEVYRPTTKDYGEVTSLSNCTDYQARDLNIKFKNDKGENEVVHTLNNTAMATSRALVAIMENYQQKDGSIKIPEVLQKYTGFKEIKPQ
ncbi:serine--tRNA ligase [Candidatus Woesearchaeota archaeon]|nr:serine--tRNA ligase [Candidatus Woesearchaeota archaeon]